MDDAPGPTTFAPTAAGARRDPALSPPDDGRLRGSDTAARAFALIAKSALNQIAANAAVLREARRLEAVHQLRVGLRRLRGALSLFEPMLAGPGHALIKAELKWLTGELNDARNIDVFITESFRPAARRHRDWPGMAALGKVLLAAQTKAYDRAQTAARSARFGVLMIEAGAWIDAGDWSQDPAPETAALRERPIGAVAPELLADSLKKVVKRGRKLETLDPEARHRLRLRAKRLRYATAFFADLYKDEAPKAYRRFNKAIQRLQDALGAQTDLAAAAALAAEIAGVGVAGVGSDRQAPAVAFAAGLVAAERAAAEAAAEAASLKAYARFREAERFW